jgi:D-alanyl-D-alanine carboxypeptidase/D-alanyl-D-alanine-endopeptidase (penicillin-binding protein 4)
MRWIAISLFACAMAAPAQTLSEKLDALLKDSPVAQHAFVGVSVYDLAKGEPVYASNADRLFVPASNTKLFTTAMALTRLGPDYRFHTVVRQEGADLVLVGGGDPTLSGRAVPYQKGPDPNPPLAAIEALADQVAARGITRIDGDIIGDDTAYVWEPYPSGWAEDDGIWDYGAPVSALTVNDNVFTLTLRAAEAGEPPALSLSPALEYFTIDNRVRTGPGLENRVRIERPAGTRQLRLWGAMPSDPATETRLLLAIDDPALYAATAFADALERRGIAIRGRPVARHRFPNETPEPTEPPAGAELARRDSQPLSETLTILAKVSQNLHAEMALREVARVRRGVGSRQAGLEEERDFLKEVGIERTDYQFADGSGLARSGLVTPGAIVALLRYMYASPYRDQWIPLLPVGGEDGTLSTRFDGNPAAARIHAKTGSLSHVAALSGYAEKAGGGTLAFSILVNNFNTQSAGVRALIDKIALLIAE